MSSTTNLNFPLHLNITPSFHSSLILEDAFAENAQRKAIHDYGIAGRVWEAAYAIILYVNPPPIFEFDPIFIKSPPPRTVIELGSGTGVIAAAIATVIDPHQDLVIATELPEVLPLLERNISASPKHALLVRSLPWGDDNAALRSEIFVGPHPRALTHIICSDLVYFPELFASLLRSLIQLTSPLFVRHSPQPMIIISHKIRSFVREAPFWSAFGLWFDFRPIQVKSDSDSPSNNEKGKEKIWRRWGEDMDDNIFVFVAHRRIESLYWRTPQDDSALMHGIGARNSVEEKRDDTFESLLLMSSFIP